MQHVTSGIYQRAFELKKIRAKEITRTHKRVFDKAIVFHPFELLLKICLLRYLYLCEWYRRTLIADQCGFWWQMPWYHLLFAREHFKNINVQKDIWRNVSTTKFSTSPNQIISPKTFIKTKNVWISRVRLVSFLCWARMALAILYLSSSIPFLQKHLLIWLGPTRPLGGKCWNAGVECYLYLWWQLCILTRESLAKYRLLIWMHVFCGLYCYFPRDSERCSWCYGRRKCLV